MEATEILLSQLKIDNGELRIEAEYWKKEHLNFEKNIENKNPVPLSKLASFLIGPFGSAFNTENYVENGNYRYIRGQDVKPFILQDSDNKYMPESDFLRLRKYSLKENDVLVSVVGTLGNACIIQEKDLPAIFSCKSTAIRTSNKLNPLYLVTYLNSKYGNSLLLRNERGAIQKGLNLTDLERIKIPLLPDSFQNKIAEMVKSAHKKLEQSKLLYKQAEEILEKELGIDFESLTKKKSVEFSIVNSQSSIFLSGRLDAEYYQEKYDNLFSFLEKSKTRKLGEIVKITKSIEPGSDCYLDSGIPFYRVSNLSEQELSTPEIFLDEKTFSDVVRPKKNTILFSKDGSIGTAYKVRQDLDGITSGALLHLTVTDKEILPDYLTLVLNSKIVKMQADRDAGGSIIQHWKPSEIKEVVIPVLADSVQSTIAEKITESFRLREESKRLLEDAKLAVEREIEGEGK